MINNKIKFIKRILATTLISLSLISCTTTSKDWNVTHHKDEFTNTKTCRVTKSSEAMRDFVKGYTGNYFTQYFYAENNNGEVRAGVMSDPPIPINGDIQIKVGSSLYNITVRDTPIDYAPSSYNYMKSSNYKYIEEMTKDIQKMSSPYRALTGKKAKKLLKDMVKYKGEVIHRTIGINSATSSTARFTVGDKFGEELKKCNINLN